MSMMRFCDLLILVVWVYSSNGLPDLPVCGPGEYEIGNSGNCRKCGLGTYKPSQGDRACTPCPDTEDGFPQTTKDRGATDASQCVPTPSIKSFFPSYGPVSGGTNLTVSLVYMPNNSVVAVTVAGILCPLLVQEDLSTISNYDIGCITGPSESAMTGDIEVTLDDGTTFTSQQYEYKPDPIVTQVQRNETIISGGILMNIYGENLNSTAQPILEITRVYKDEIAVFHTPCKVYSSRIVPCVMPALYDGFYHPLLMTRQKRQIGDVIFNDIYTHFYAGVIFDGVTDYRNFSEVFPSFHQLEVHIDPVIYMFEDRVQRYDPDEDPHDISIWGQYINSVLTEDDILVTVGKGFCNISSKLSSNHFTCRPPPNEPVPEEEDHGPDGAPRVRVHIGVFIKFTVGYLDYTSGDSGIMELVLGIVAGILVVATIVIVIVCCIRRSRMAKENQNPRLENSTEAVPNIYARKQAVSGDGYLVPLKTNGHAVQGTMSSIPSHPSTLSSRSVQSHQSGGSSLSQITIGQRSIDRPSVITLGKGRPSVTTLNNNGRSSGAVSNRTSVSNSNNNHGRTSVTTHGRPSLASLITLQRSSQSTSPPSTPGITPSTPGTISLASSAFASDPQTPLTSTMLANVAYQIFPQFSFSILDILDSIDEDLRYTLDDCLIDMSRLKLSDTLGKGFFGKVYMGSLADEENGSDTIVAVKTVQGKQCKLNDITSFLEEAVVMKDFDHPNVLSLLGVALDETKPYVILPYMEHGDLKTYIADPNLQVTVRELIGFGTQIACGMTYLAAQKFVHRDLATRNCMVNAEKEVKIADFGLSRDIYKSDYYRVETKHRPLPVKWMALESLIEGVFSTKTDVWSFGVVLWELLTRACSPYAEVDSFKMKAYLQSGRRLAQPDHAPDEVYEIMKSCWLENPDERPSFRNLHQDLKAIGKDKAEEPPYLQLI